MSEEQGGAVVVELEAVVAATNAVTVPDAVRAALVKDLGPLAGRIEEFNALAQSFVVADEATAMQAARICDEIATGVKLVKEHEILTKITTGLHGLHRRWTAFRDTFVAPLEASRKTLKGKVISWQEAERAKAEAEQRRLQAEADAKARAEQERLLKKAAACKTVEKQEQYQQQAASVAAPRVTVVAPKAGVKVQRVWVVKAIDLNAFYAALAQRSDLRGFVTIDRVRLARAKAANTAVEVPGVEFVQKVR